ncbi:hypothetical protein [Solilutibacter silvestris]|uniref:hypothetical protein n=1 Tax=Solilutibacter silvestris TaxID=1645665 RepID=UPI003D32BB06
MMQIALRLPVDLADIDRQPSWGSVLTYCASKSGKRDKTLASDMEMQEAVWSRCKSDQNAPNGEQLVRLMDSAGNLAPLYWLMLRAGLDPGSVRPLESETERALREAKEALDQERLKVRVLTEALHGRPLP